MAHPRRPSTSPARVRVSPAPRKKKTPPDSPQSIMHQFEHPIPELVLDGTKAKPTAPKGGHKHRAMFVVVIALLLGAALAAFHPGSGLATQGPPAGQLVRTKSSQLKPKTRRLSRALSTPVTESGVATVQKPKKRKLVAGAIVLAVAAAAASSAPLLLPSVSGGAAAGSTAAAAAALSGTAQAALSAAQARRLATILTVLQSLR